MKHFLTTALLLVSALAVTAQSTLRFEVEPRVQADTLVLDYYVQKTAGADFPLGTSNLPIFLNEQALDLDNAVFAPNVTRTFDASNSSSYLAMDKGVRGFLNINVKRRYPILGTGELVESNRKFVARVLVPITDPCQTCTIEWNVAPLAITNLQGTNIKQYTTFQDVVTPFALCEKPLAPAVTASANTTICRGDNLVLTANVADDVVWFKDGVEMAGVTGANLIVTESGNYEAKVMACPVCASDASQAISVQVTETPQIPTLDFVAGVLSASDAVGDLQWYKDGQPIAGAIGATFEPTGEGMYTLGVSNSCGQVFSAPFSITSTLELVSAFSMEVYPNPFDVQTQLRFRLPETGKVRIEAMNILSQSVTVLQEAELAEGEHVVDLNAEKMGWASGVYMLSLHYQGQTNNIKLVLNK